MDVKGAAFEGLLEKAASEGKKGAGQYFTPRVLIQSIVRVMQPDPRTVKDFKVCDPACGTGGFLVCAYEWLFEKTKGAFDRIDAKHIRTITYFGQDLVARPRRLALMNLYPHNVEPQIKLGDTIYEPPGSEKFDCILTNPPFGTKGSGQAPDREDFTIETSNKQLNFIQHVVNTLKPGGRAAMVLPDNCLFEGKAGEVFEILMQDCNLHTVLRLPRGTFTPFRELTGGSAAPHLNVRDIKEFPVPLPPLPEQQEIVRRIESYFTLADQLEARYYNAKTHIDRLTQSILAKAFRGELVPQNPTDEPASALLERIRTQGDVSKPLKMNKELSDTTVPKKRRSRTIEPPPVVASFDVKSLSAHARKIYRHMKRNREYSKDEIVVPLILSTSEWNSAIRELKESGAVVQAGNKRGARYSKYN